MLGDRFPITLSVSFLANDEISANQARWFRANGELSFHVLKREDRVATLTFLILAIRLLRDHTGFNRLIAISVARNSRLPARILNVRGVAIRLMFSATILRLSRVLLAKNSAH